MANFYETLGVTPSASPEAIKQAYHALAKQYHPDRHHGDANREVYEAKMAEVTEAYSVLSDPQARATYDRTLTYGSRVGTSAPPPPPPPPDGCQICGCVPTAVVTLRRGVGLIIFRRRAGLTGRFCQSCGIGIFRQVQNSTLLFGWWGILSFFANFTYILRNLGAWMLLKGLAPPGPRPGWSYAVRPEPMPATKPLYRRAGIYVATVFLIWLGASFANHHASNAGGSSSNSTPQVSAPAFAVGDCVSSAGNEITGVVSCGAFHFAKVVAITTSVNNCPPSATNDFIDSSSESTVCLDSTQ